MYAFKILLIHFYCTTSTTPVSNQHNISLDTIVKFGLQPAVCSSEELPFDKDKITG